MLLILTSLSILWDFGVFTQPYLLIGQAHIHPSNYLMGIYLFEEGYLKTDYGRGAAISLLMLVIVAAAERLLRAARWSRSETWSDARARSRRSGWNVVGIALFVVMVFPVFWMISTAFKPDDQINSLTPTWFSLHPTLHHFRDAIHTPFFWTDVKNSADHRARHGRDLDRARVPRRGRAREVPLHRAASSSSS